MVHSSWSSKWASPPNSGKNAWATTPVEEKLYSGLLESSFSRPAEQITCYVLLSPKDTTQWDSPILMHVGAYHYPRPKTSLCSSHPPARQRCPHRHGRPSQIWGMVVGDNEKPDLDVDPATWSPERERRRSLPHGKRLAYLVQSELYWFIGLGKRLENTWKTLGVPDPFSIQFLLFDF